VLHFQIYDSIKQELFTVVLHVDVVTSLSLLQKPFDGPANGDPDAFKLAKYVLTIGDRYRASNVETTLLSEIYNEAGFVGLIIDMLVARRRSERQCQLAKLHFRQFFS
jgi:hypothetical protein